MAWHSGKKRASALELDLVLFSNFFTKFFKHIEKLKEGNSEHPGPLPVLTNC